MKASSSTLSDPEIVLDPRAQREFAGLIDVQVDRLSALVQNLLDMSRIQAGVLEPRRSVTSVTGLVAAVIQDLGAATREHKMDVVIAADLPPVDVDIVLISRVLTNIIENAVRHSPDLAAITVQARQAGPEAIEVSVVDHGPGVSPDRREQIFGFYPRRARDTGAGLGLAIAKTFVEAHGQRIWVENAPDGGARFCFTVPVAPVVPEEAQLAAGAHH